MGKFGFDSSALVEAGFYTEGYRSVDFNVKVNSFNVTTDLDKEKPETKLPEEDAKEPEEKSDACVLKGDCDNNGAVNTADYLIMKKYLLGIQDTNVNIDSLDLDGDGKVNISDYILLRNILLDLT